MTDSLAADPRIGALTQLATALLTEYGNLASAVLSKLDDTERAELIEHVAQVREETLARIGEIAGLGGFAQPAGEPFADTDLDEETDHQRRVREATERTMRISRGLMERLAPYD
jgi:hypothetical protein